LGSSPPVLERGTGGDPDHGGPSGL
jgi:hypothetical protein